MGGVGGRDELREKSIPEREVGRAEEKWEKIISEEISTILFLYNNNNEFPYRGPYNSIQCDLKC